MTTKNRTGSKHAAANALGSLDDRLRQLAAITPGADGGGSVATPFKIGDYIFGPGEQVDTNKLADIARPGDRWEAQPFLPTISQGVSTNISYTTRYSEVLLTPDEVVWNFFFDITGTGTAASGLVVTLPFVAFRTAVTYVGQVQLYDSSLNTRLGLEAETQDSSLGTAFQLAGDTTAGTVWGVTPSIAIASADQIRGMLRYRPRNPR
jgi:hypothetical protein